MSTCTRLARRAHTFSHLPALLLLVTLPLLLLRPLTAQTNYVVAPAAPYNAGATPPIEPVVVTQTHYPGETPGPHSGYHCSCMFYAGPGSVHAGDPVELSRGALQWSQTDLAIGGPAPMALTRHHCAEDFTPGPFGPGSSMDYDTSLTVDTQSGGYQVVSPKNERACFDTQVGGNSGGGDPYWTDSKDPTYAGSKLVVAADGTYTLTYPDGAKLFFGTSGALLGTRDRFGVGLNFFRNENSYLVAITHTTDAATILLSYNADGLLDTATDSLSGRSVHYTYDANHCVSTFTDVSGGVTHYTWQETSYGGFYTAYALTTVVDPRGLTALTNTYDDQGRVATQRIGGGGLTTFEYVPQPDGTQVTRVTDANGNATQYCYEHTNSFSYHLLWVQNPLGRTTTYTYYGFPYPIPYLASVTDFRGRTVTYDYDANGNVSAAHRPTLSGGTATTYYTYDPTYNTLTSVTDERGQTATATLNAQGLPITLNSPTGAQAHATYNAYGLPITATDPASHTTTVSYSGDLRPLQVTNTLNQSTSITYDAYGRPQSATDNTNRTLTVGISASGRPTGVSGPGGSGYGVSYTANLPTQLTAEGGATHAWTYDSAGSVSSGTDPAGATESVTRDPNGNPLVITDRKGQRTEYTYGPGDRLQQVTYKRSNGTVDSTVTYTYDPNTDLLSSIADTAGPGYSFTYNALDEVATMTGPEGVTTYSYDDLGRLSSVLAPGQAAVVYSYDTPGRLCGVQQGAAQVTYGFDGAGRLSSVTHPNGVVTSYFYDALNRVYRVEHHAGATLLEDEEFSWDAGGRITGRERNGAVSSFGYDNVDRLTSYTLPGHTGTFGYDLAGNRTSQTVDGASNTLSYAPNGTNRLTLAGGAALAHDADGSVTQYGTATLTWDARGRLVQVVDGGTTSTYTYDCFNRRTAKTVNGVTTRYAYQGSDLSLEMNAAGTVTAAYFYEPGVDCPVSRTDASGTVYYLKDLSGNVAALTSGTGALLGTYQYTPWGQVVSSTSGLPAQPLRWGCRELDETGLYYLRGRYYDAGTGRFLSEDPGGLAASLNLYTYALNNPLGMVDPYGADAERLDDESTGWNDVVSLGKLSGGYSGNAGGYVVNTMVNLYSAAPGVGSTIGIGSGVNNLGKGNYQGAAVNFGTVAAPMAIGGVVHGIGGLVSDALEGEGGTLGAGGGNGSVGSGRRISNVPDDSFQPNPNITSPYRRPSGAGPTPAQRASVQGQPCVECGKVTPNQVADHIEPLAVEYYRTGTNDVAAQSSLGAVQSHCPSCSNAQGGYLSQFSRRMKGILGF